MKLARITSLLCLPVILVACTGNPDTPSEEELLQQASGSVVENPSVRTLPIVSGAKAGSYSVALLDVRGAQQNNRPSAPLGIYASTYLAQGSFLITQGAIVGMQAQQKLIEGQTLPTASENFALLKEYASILQVDVVDTLNRSTDRAAALDQYLKALSNMTTIVLRKAKELETLEDDLNSQRRDKKREVDDLDRTINRAIRDQDYSTASDKQEDLVRAQAELAALESRQDQTEDMLERFEDLIAIAGERATAISSNRRILIAGLKVIDVPGIEDFNILDADKRYRRRRSRKNLNSGLDPFGIFNAN